jgi:hypothetical protein
VAIYRLLLKSGFGSDDTLRMGEAYELALVELGLKNRNDPLTEIVAKLIIEVAQTGLKDSRTICANALSQLRHRQSL